MSDAMASSTTKRHAKPTAAVLITAESNEQLTNILLSLSRAVEQQSWAIDIREQVCSDK